jgi:hypothetical protein
MVFVAGKSIDDDGGMLSTEKPRPCPSDLPET